MKNLIKTLLACALLICGANSKTLREGTLKVATEGTFSPFSYYNDKNELVGYDVDVARAVAEKLGLKIEFLTAPWDAMLAAFDAGKADAVFNQVSITDERKKKYEYSVPYTVVYGAIIVHKDNNDIKSLDDLKGKKYGAQNVTVDSFAKSMELLIARRVDTVVRDNTVFYDFLKQRPDAPIKIAAKLKDVDYSAAIVQKGNKELANQISKALNELKAEGKLKEISLKYFGKDVSE